LAPPGPPRSTCTGRSSACASRCSPLPAAQRACEAAWAEAEAIRADDAATCDAIGRHGLRLIREIAARRPARCG
jgi:hypothetical protein